MIQLTFLSVGISKDFCEKKNERILDHWRSLYTYELKGFWCWQQRHTNLDFLDLGYDLWIQDKALKNRFYSCLESRKRLQSYYWVPGFTTRLFKVNFVSVLNIKQGTRGCSSATGSLWISYRSNFTLKNFRWEKFWWESDPNKFKG